MLSAYVLDGYSKPEEHSRSGKRDMLKFRLELTHQLVGGFTSRQCIGRPRTGNIDLHCLANSHIHWPIFVEKKGNCVVCHDTVCVKKLSRVGNRHEYNVKIVKYIFVLLKTDRNCFKRYATLVDYIC